MPPVFPVLPVPPGMAIVPRAMAQDQHWEVEVWAKVQRSVQQVSCLEWCLEWFRVVDWVTSQVEAWPWAKVQRSMQQVSCLEWCLEWFLVMDW